MSDAKMGSIATITAIRARVEELQTYLISFDGVSAWYAVEPMLTLIEDTP